jgi:hypothetical protein
MTLIAIDHATLTAPKLLYAKIVLRKVKSQGQASWAWYKGNAEFMVWAENDRNGVISDVFLADIIELYNADKNVSKLLYLNVFTPGSQTLEVNHGLRQKTITINAASATARGRLAAKLVGASQRVNLHHIEDRMARLVGGAWGPQCCIAGAELLLHILQHARLTRDLTGRRRASPPCSIHCRAIFSVLGRLPARWRCLGPTVLYGRSSAAGLYPVARQACNAARGEAD